MSDIRILLVDDDDLFAGMLEKVLTHAGYQTTRARNGREALFLYEADPPDLVITDMIMPDIEGVELISRVRTLNRGTKIIAISGGGRNRPDTYLTLAQHLGAMSTLAKPFSSKQLLAAIEKVMGMETEACPEA